MIYAVDVYICPESGCETHSLDASVCLLHDGPPVVLRRGTFRCAPGSLEGAVDAERRYAAQRQRERAEHPGFDPERPFDGYEGPDVPLPGAAPEDIPGLRVYRGRTGV